MSSQDASSIPWNADSKKFPTRHELPKIPDAPEGAAWVWGKEDFIGRLNLLTPARVAAASKAIQSGEIVPVNLPLDTPSTPAFGREPFKHTIKPLVEGLAYDDLYEMNTQSGTQWDGFRHFAHLSSGNFYNGTKGSDIMGDNANHKCSIHHWAEHGIAGRGVLIDYWGYAKKNGKTYDPFSWHGISYDELTAAAKDQGLDIRPAAQGGDIQIGDMLFIRSGFNETYQTRSHEELEKLGKRHSGLGEDNETEFAGVLQEEKILDWFHDCYFASVAGDAPSFEAWPSKEKYYLHEHILALWGMPLGEMLDLEKLAKTCREKSRWTFFFTSSPANVPAGVASHVNGQAIF